MHVKNFYILSIIILLCLSLACTVKSPYPPDVTKTLKAAGDNRAELEKVLSHYITENDSLKLKAAYYLIANMEGHCYATYILQDSTEAEIDFNVLDYPDYDSLRAACDILEARLGELDFERDELIYDMDTITADLLINQIDYAFLAWNEKPWAKELSFEKFCEYILPYRGSNEPLEPWRKTFWDKYESIESDLTDSTDPIEAACLINDDIKSWFKFDPRYYYHPTDQGLTEMLNNRMGRCEDMTNITIYAMRANGLAVTSDYTPHWANAGNNHAWNAIIAPDGRVIPFMGAESNPGKYKLANKLAKVYRKMFGMQKQNLTFLEKKQEKVPGWLAGKSYLDVTADYIDVCDVTVTFKKDIPDSVDIAYLCVFNAGKWKAIHWGRIENQTATFTDMGKDIAYLPALYIDEEIEPFGAPFILRDDCSMEELSPEMKDTSSMQLTTITCDTITTSPNGLKRVPLTSGLEYELFYLQDGWQSHGKAVADNKPLVFKKVPAGCLYWLTEVDSDEEERIFIIEDGELVWW